MMCCCWDDQERMDETGLSESICGTVEAGKLAQEAGVKKLVLVHSTPELCRPGDMERGIADVSKFYDGEIIFAEGEQVDMVVSVTAGACRVEIDGEIVDCVIRGSLTAQETGATNAVAVGDRVVVTEDGAGGFVVEDVLPRRTVLARRDGALQQVIVANAEQLLIVSSWREPAIWLELVDRYLIAAMRYGLEPVVCVNKADLIEDEGEFESTLKPYHTLGHDVLRTSALTGEGVDALRTRLEDRMTVLSGLSGTGKSSLLSAVQPGLDLRIGEVCEWRRDNVPPGRLKS